MLFVVLDEAFDVLDDAFDDSDVEFVVSSVVELALIQAWSGKVICNNTLLLNEMAIHKCKNVSFPAVVKYKYKEMLILMK